MKDNRTLLLGLLTLGLVGTWAYHFYDKSQYVKISRKNLIADSIAVAVAMRDSLQDLYMTTVNKMDSPSGNSDSIAALKGELGERMREINLLKNNIGTILRKKLITASDLREARSMVKELQQKLATVQNENSSLTKEKDKLNSIFEMLNKEMTIMQKNMQRVSNENKDITQKLTTASTFVASELRLAAMNLRSEEKDIETHSLKKADKFVVSFVVQNYITDVPGAELIIAIREPSGMIMIGEGWNAGTFDTKTEGRKEYTRKVRFEYIKGEQKRLIFSIQTEKFQKGIYKMYVYHNGNKIGETSWMLS